MLDLTQPASPPLASRRARLSAVPRHRLAILFVFLLLSITVYPYAESSTLGYYTFRILGSFIILLTVYAVTSRRNLVVLLLCLAVPSLLQRILLLPSGAVALVNRLLSLVFDAIVLAILFRRVYSEQKPTSETIFGALSIYLLLGFVFASVYSLIVSLQPNAFFLDPVTNLHQVPDRFDFIYFSFGTITELGAPGIAAISREARSVSLLEAVLGIFYLAVLISRIMGSYRPVISTAQEIPVNPQLTRHPEP